MATWCRTPKWEFPKSAGGGAGTSAPEGPRIENIQSREAILKKSSFQYGMKFSIENGFFIPGPSLTAEEQGPGLKFSIENENFKPRMKFSSENENFVCGGMVFSCVRARMNFFDLRALWGWKKWGCWPECWQAGPFVNRENTRSASTRASTPSSTPILPALVPTPMPALFGNSHFGVLCQVARISTLGSRKLRVLSATFILSKNSRVLDAKVSAKIS